MSGFVLGVDADRDINETWEFVAVDDLDAADRCEAATPSRS